MNLKTIALEMFRKNNREAKLDFYNHMTDSIVKYKNAIDEAIDALVSSSMDSDYGKEKRLYHKKRCKALIAMDHEQLQAAHLFEMHKIINERIYDSQMQTAAIEKSVWFSGDPNTPAYH